MADPVTQMQIDLGASLWRGVLEWLENRGKRETKSHDISHDIMESRFNEKQITSEGITQEEHTRRKVVEYMNRNK